MQDDEAFAARRVGLSVGRYRLERVIGVGGMAAVYAARSDAAEQVAIKLLHPEVGARRELRERFQREGTLANSIQHPGVVRILEHGDAGELGAFLVMELLQGETLAARARRVGGLPEAELLQLADQVLDVLKVAHERGVIHRDLKPDNLFITQSGAVKILDFGLARLAEVAHGDSRTRSGVALGTLPYMAPEQALGRRQEIDGRVDVFALGATLFRMLSGRRIHEAGSEAELLMAMASQAAPGLATVAPQVSASMCQIVDLALAFARDARYPDAGTMQQDVRAVLAHRAPPYALQRMLHREQKTRTEPMPPGEDVRRGPRGTLAMELPRPVKSSIAPESFGTTLQSPHAPVPARVTALPDTASAPDVRAPSSTLAEPSRALPESSTASIEVQFDATVMSPGAKKSAQAADAVAGRVRPVDVRVIESHPPAASLDSTFRSTGVPSFEGDRPSPVLIAHRPSPIPARNLPATVAMPSPPPTRNTNSGTTRVIVLAVVALLLSFVVVFALLKWLGS